MTTYLLSPAGQKLSWVEWKQMGGCDLSNSTRLTICQRLQIRPKDFVNYTLGDFQAEYLVAGRELARFAKENFQAELYYEFEPRQISNKELANLSNEWENPTVDITKYYQNVMQAWEVDKELYNLYKSHGGLCQVHKGRYYIA